MARTLGSRNRRVVCTWRIKSSGSLSDSRLVLPLAPNRPSSAHMSKEGFFIFTDYQNKKIGSPSLASTMPC
jgi:hypothetical protein